MLAKDNVRIELLIDRYHYNPGETIKGMLRLTVKSKIPVTAVRVTLIGKEQVKIKGPKGKEEEELIHFKKVITPFGFSIESGRKGGAQLDAGSYAYPFTFPLPTSIPPSYFCSIKKGDASLTYKVKGQVEIPRGFNATKEKVITIRSMAPIRQIQDSVNTVKTVADDSNMLTTTFCCKPSKNSRVKVAAHISPSIVVVKVDENQELDRMASAEVEKAYQEENVNGGYAVGPSPVVGTAAPYYDNAEKPQQKQQPQYQQYPPPQQQYMALPVNSPNNGAVASNHNTAEPNTLYVRVDISNTASWRFTPVGTVCITLEETRILSCHGQSISETVPITSNVHELNPQPATNSDTFTINVKLPRRLSYTNDGSKEVAPLPSFATLFLETHLAIRFSFPDNKKMTSFCSNGQLCLLTQWEDETLQAPPLPVMYKDPLILPEEEYMGR